TLTEGSEDTLVTSISNIELGNLSTTPNIMKISGYYSHLSTPFEVPLIGKRRRGRTRISATSKTSKRIAAQHYEENHKKASKKQQGDK
ncbi:hypothetical protein ADUPG1_001719, partial [Aduncisulcus paluster]